MSTPTTHDAVADLKQNYYEEESELRIALAVKTQELFTRTAQAKTTDEDLGHYILYEAAQEIHSMQRRLQELRLNTQDLLKASAEVAQQADKSTLKGVITYYVKEIELILWEAENDVADLGTSIVSSAVSTLDPAEEANTNSLPAYGTPPAVIHRRAPPEVLALILADDRRNHGWRWWWYHFWNGLNGSLESITYWFLLQSIAYALWKICHFLTHVLSPGPCPYADYYVLGGLRRNDTAPLCWIV